MRNRTSLCAAAAIGLLAGTVQAQTVDDTLSGQTMFGINRTNGQLSRFDFAPKQLTAIGPVATDNGKTLTGIDAAVLLPGLTNIYAFWQDTSDGYKNKLVYVDANTGRAVIVADDLEGGKFMGATHFAMPDNPYTVFAVQAAKIKPPSTISGLANINPNNTDSNEFTCKRGDGSTFTRDHLHKDSPLSGDGTYYQGEATLLHLKPKGNGNQNGLIINGQPFVLKNSNTYTFTGSMQVRVFNDKVSGGKAMGHWWVQVVSGEVIINNDVQVLSPQRLSKVDQKTGEVTELMVLSRAYNSLATMDGSVFFASAGGELFKLDTVAMTETKVGVMGMSKTAALEACGPFMFAYDAALGALAPIDAATGQNLASPANLGMGEMGTMMFNPVSQDPVFKAAQFD